MRCGEEDCRDSKSEVSSTFREMLQFDHWLHKLMDGVPRPTWERQESAFWCFASRYHQVCSDLVLLKMKVSIELWVWPQFCPSSEAGQPGGGRVHLTHARWFIMDTGHERPTLHPSQLPPYEICRRLVLVPQLWTSGQARLRRRWQCPPAGGGICPRLLCQLKMKSCCNGFSSRGGKQQSTNTLSLWVDFSGICLGISFSDNINFYIRTQISVLYSSYLNIYTFIYIYKLKSN